MSKIGMPKARAGKARATRVADFDTHMTLAVAIVKPRNKLPQSPMNTLAGLKLKIRKPARLPTIAREKTAIITSLLRAIPSWMILPCSANAAMTPQVIADTPAAKPSRPSLILTAFVIPTIHNTVIG